LTGGFYPPRLRKSLSFASVLAILAVLSLSGVSVAFAQSTAWTSSGWVTSATVQDLTGNANLASDQPLLAGHSYNVTLDIVVPNTSTSTSNFSVSLNPALAPAATGPVGAFWAVHNPSYGGYAKAIFVPGKPTVTFNFVQGTLKLSAYFQVPSNFTNPVAKYSAPSGNGTIRLHIPQEGVILVSVVPFLSTGIGSFSATVQDQTIQTYLTDYNQTSALVPSGKIPSTYSSLVNSLLGEAAALNKIGLPDNGTALLNVIVPSAFPTPPNSSLQTDLLVGLAAAIVVIVLLAVLTMRSRGRSGYSSHIINDVQKDLAVLEVTAAKYDRAMADKLKSLRDKLSESK